MELREIGHLRVLNAVRAAEHVAHLRRRPGDTGPPLGGVVEVREQQVVIQELARGAPGVRERAGRQDPLIDARVGVRDPLLRERPAGAPGADRVAERAVGLDDVLLGHDQGLGLQRQVAVVPAVVERGRHRDEALAERGAVGACPGRARSVARLVINRARRAMRDQQLVVELRLGRDRRPRLRSVDRARRSGTGRGPCSPSRPAR